MRSAALLACVLVGLTIASCKEPTQIDVRLSTDVDCAHVGDVEVRTAGTPEELASAAPGAVATGCERPDGTLGNVVLRPSGARDGRVVLSATLVPSGGACTQTDRSGCPIEARRILSYIPSTPLRLPIALRAACQGVQCAPNDTCVKGVCRSAVVDSTQCTRTEGCDEETVGAVADGGVVPPTDAGADVATDGGKDAGQDAATNPCAPYAGTQPPYYRWPFDEGMGTSAQQVVTPTFLSPVTNSAWRQGVCGAALATDVQATLAPSPLPFGDVYVAAWVLFPASVAAPFPLLSTLDGTQHGWELQLAPGPGLVLINCAGIGLCDGTPLLTAPAGWHTLSMERSVAGGLVIGIDGQVAPATTALRGAPIGGPLRVGGAPSAILDELHVFDKKP